MASHEASGITVAEVAHRLGVAPATLRTWDRRYGLGPSSHEAGEHRRYSDEDLARLAAMRRLVVSGVPPQQAALVAKSTPIALDEPLPLPKFQNRDDVVAAIIRALDGIDSGFVEALIRREILASFQWESILLCTLGGVGGALLSFLADGIQTGTTSFDTFSDISFAFTITPRLLAQGLFFSVGMGILGGLLPAWRASNIPRTEAMKG